MTDPEQDDLDGFGGTTRLFPLPGVVLFPNVVLPLHIFEPRYRLLVGDALASDRLITLVQARSPAEFQDSPERGLEPVACLGRIVGHEALSDGRCNMLLLGLRRCSILRELPRTRLYREAQIELIEDVEIGDSEESVRLGLIDQFRQHAVHENLVDPDLDSILEADIPIGVLADILGHTLRLPPPIKQALLDEPTVQRRVDRLMRIMSGATPDARSPGSEREPPGSFSVN